MSAISYSETALLDEIQQLRAQAARLKAERQVTKEVIEQAPVMISIVRAPDFVYELVNPAYQALAPGMEFRGRRFAEVWPEAAGPVIEMLQNVIATGRGFHSEEAQYRIRRGPDLQPEEVYFSYSCLPLFNPEGTPDRVLTLAHEVTGAVRQRERLRQSLERLEKVLAIETVGVVFWDLNTGRVLDANDAFFKLIGYRRGEEQARDLSWQLLTPPEYMDISRAEVEELLSTGRGRAYEKEYFCKDGTRRWILFASSLLDTDQAVEFCVDISDRKAAEEALRRSEERFRGLVSASSEVLYLMSPDWSEMRQLSGGHFLSDTEAPNRNWLQDYIPPDDQPLVMAAVREAIRNRSVFKLEHRVRRKDGASGWTSSRAIPRLDAEGRIIEWFGAASDITERIEAEQRLRQIQKLESVGLLAAGIAHDFNNILTAVMGSASLLLEDARPEHAKRLRSIIAGTERAAHLTRQLLAYSGKGQFVIRDLDVTQAVYEMADLVQFSIPKHVDLRLDLQRRLPPVAMDPGQLQQVLMNLVINAGEAIGDGNPGRITVLTTMADLQSPLTDEIGSEVAPGRYVRVEVRDSGSGMGPETKARIFDPFFTTKFVGRGLGLAAVAGILRSQRGGIMVESAPGKGSTFQVFLPAAGKADPVVEEPASQGGGPVVLVVDDEVSVREFIGAVLRRKGYQIIEASDGIEALTAAGSAPGGIDAAIIDIVMPNMSANRLLPALKAKQPGIPILITSGYSEDEARRLCAAYPDAAFIQKPYTARQIGEAVEKLVSRSVRGGGKTERQQ